MENCPEKTGSSSLSAVLMGNRNRTELYLKLSRCTIQDLFIETTQQVLTGWGFHCSIRVFIAP